MARRVEKIQQFLVDSNIDALLIKSKEVKKWMETMTGSGCNFLITKTKGYLICDGRYIVEAKEKEKDLEIILHNPHVTGRDYLGVVEQLLQENNWKTMGIEADVIGIKAYQSMLKLGVEIILLEQEIPKLRSIKEDEEIERMKEVISITDDILQKTFDKIYVGMTENELCAWLLYYSYSAGAQAMSFDTIITSGPRTALPHGRPTNRKIQAHEPIMIDFGIQYNNYQSDITRMCFIGEPTKEIKEIYDVVLEAQLAGLKAIKEGVVASDVDRAARDVITKAGYGDYFDHGLGHGLGIGEGGEMPTLNSTSKTILENGMMMSCEPGVYVPGVGGVRIEDDVVIIDGVGVPLNKTTKDYIILEEK